MSFQQINYVTLLYIYMMDIDRIKKYADLEFDSYKIAKAVTEVKNEIKKQRIGKRFCNE